MPSIHLSPPFLYAMGSLFFGLLGVLSWFSPTRDSFVDIWLRDTYYPIAPFHVILGFAAVFVVSAVVYFGFPQMLGRNLNDRLGQLHFLLTVVAACVLILALQIVLIYPDKKVTMVLFLTVFVILVAQFLFVLNLLWSLFRTGE
jgi:cytochrome c oxidase subunit I